MSEKELQQGVEVTVSLLGSYNQRLLDLDQGLTLRPPDAPTFALWSAERRREFLRANGVDLMITGNGRTTWGLATPVGNDTKLKRVPLDSWTSASLPDISWLRPWRPWG